MAKDAGKGFITLLIASGVVITIDELQRGQLAPARYFGLIAGFFLLSFIASFEPEFAYMLAWLFFIALLLQRGTRVFAAVARKAKAA